jgi:YggT family protein
VRDLLCALFTVYFVVLVARIILSWFPVRPGTALSSISSIVYELTEPVLAPVRRVIPAIGMFDISPIVVFIALQILQAAVCRG